MHARKGNLTLPGMELREAVLRRKSVRAYADRPVSRTQVERLLDLARHAPSGANTQPWLVAVVTGRTKHRLQQRLTQAFENGEPSRMDYPYYPEHWSSPYRERRFACGMQLYRALNIQREDIKQRRAQWAANYRAFDAPVMLFFFIDDRLARGSWIDYGMFLQTLMLAAVDEGLSTCPQAALAEYPDIVRDELGYASHLLLLCGMALGYEDTSSPANSYRTPREEIHAFTRFFD